MKLALCLTLLIPFHQARYYTNSKQHNILLSRASLDKNKLKEINAQCNSDRGDFREQGKVMLPESMCPLCDVCGADQVKGRLREAEKWCQKSGGDICRGGCSCPIGMFRHNMTKLIQDQIVKVETCISAKTCQEIISGVKCPYPQIWSEEAPFCIRTCENKDGADAAECPQFWVKRCICPNEKPIFHQGRCIDYDECPEVVNVVEEDH